MSTPARPDYESIDWKEFERRFRTGALRAKLMRLAFTVTAIGIVVLLINLGALFWLRSNVEDLVKARAPLVDASRTTQLGMQRALASLRGWVALGDPAFREDHDAAWHGDILPGVDRISALLDGDANEDFRKRLTESRARLDDLWESQWWVADVAQTPGNEPAKVEYELHVLPVKRDLEASLFEIAELLGEGDGSAVTPRDLAALSLFQQQLAAADAALHEAIDFGHTSAIHEFERNVKRARSQLAELDSRVERFSPLQAEHLTGVAREFPWYVHHARNAIQLRSSDQWNVAQHLMATETVPLTRYLSATLDSMADEQTALMRQDSDHVSLAGNSAFILSMILIVMMVLIAYVVTNRRAHQITQPVDRLSVATTELAAGILTEDLPITTDDELGKLTFAFNHMRINLQRAEASLRDANEHMQMELEDAAAYVRSILPRPIDSDDRGIRIDWRFIASSELGGDSFGYHWLDDEHIAIYLLDVSGHGVGPAMLSISAHNALRQRTLPATDFHRPHEVLEALNRAFPMRENQNKFFTIWYGVYNWKTRELSYASGGHHPAVLLEPARPEPADLGMRNFMIGAVDDAEYESAATSVGPGSRLYVFSDGAFEIRNRDKEMLNMPGLTKHLQEAQPQEDRLQTVLESTRRWQESDDFGDDYSMLEISFT